MLALVGCGRGGFDAVADGSGTGDAWWDANWLHRRKISFDNSLSTENLLSFPVLVALNGSFDYAKTQDQGQDVRFVDADGLTQLAHEIESWNETASSSLWVGVPQIDAGSLVDHIWMYYDNVAASDAQNGGLWNSGYVGVWHLAADPLGVAPQMVDSTLYGNHGTAGGFTSNAARIAGQIGDALDYDGIDDFVDVGNGASLDNVFDNGGAFSAWIKPRSDGEANLGRILQKGEPTGAGWYCDVNRESVGAVHSACQFYQSGANGGGVTLNPALTLAVWTHYTVVFDTLNPNDFRLYLNGASVPVNVSAASGTRADDRNYTLQLGNNGSSIRTFDGAIDEARLSAVPRSDSWIAAEYRSMIGALADIGAEETRP